MASTFDSTDNKNRKLDYSEIKQEARIFLVAGH